MLPSASTILHQTYWLTGLQDELRPRTFYFIRSHWLSRRQHVLRVLCRTGSTSTKSIRRRGVGRAYSPLLFCLLSASSADVVAAAKINTNSAPCAHCTISQWHLQILCCKSIKMLTSILRFRGAVPRGFGRRLASTTNNGKFIFKENLNRQFH